MMVSTEAQLELDEALRDGPTSYHVMLPSAHVTCRNLSEFYMESRSPKQVSKFIAYHGSTDGEKSLQAVKYNGSKGKATALCVKNDRNHLDAHLYLGHLQSPLNRT